MDYCASVSDRVPNTDHVALTLSLPVPNFASSAVCRSPRSVTCWDSVKADSFVQELVRMREAGLFLVVDNACQEDDVNLAYRLVVGMVEQAARTLGVDMTRLCRCPLRPKQSTAQQGSPWFDLSAEFYGRATGNLAVWVRQGSVHAYELNIIGCSEQSVLHFIVAELAYSWPKSVLTVVLQLKGLLPRAQHKLAPVTPQAGPMSFGPTSVLNRPQVISTIRRHVSLQGFEHLALPGLLCLWLPLPCGVLSSARVTHLPLVMTALDLRSLSMLFLAVLSTHQSMFWPTCSAVVAVLCCVQAMYQKHGR
jgi:hypothetical protein